MRGHLCDSTAFLFSTVFAVVIVVVIAAAAGAIVIGGVCLSQFAVVNIQCGFGIRSQVCRFSISIVIMYWYDYSGNDIL